MISQQGARRIQTELVTFRIVCHVQVKKASSHYKNHDYENDENVRTYTL